MIISRSHGSGTERTFARIASIVLISLKQGMTTEIFMDKLQLGNIIRFER